MADHATLAEYDRKFDQRRFPAGRLIQAINPILALARLYGYEPLHDISEEAIELAMRFIEIRARREAQNMARGGGVTRAIDSKVDGNFGQIYDLLVREAKDYADERSGKQAQRMLDACFPKGLAAVTSIAYEEQLALNEYLVIVMRRDHADTIALLGLDRYLRRIEELLPDYRASMDTSDLIDATELGRAYEAMQIGLLRVVGWIMVTVRDADRRAELLTSVHDQESRLAAIFAARRRGTPTPDDVPLDELELDAEARAALDAAALAEEAIRQAEQGVDDADVDEPDAIEPEADGLPMQPIPRG